MPWLTVTMFKRGRMTVVSHQVCCFKKSSALSAKNQVELKDFEPLSLDGSVEFLA